MDDELTSRLTMKPTINLPSDRSTVDYESEGEKRYSDLQLRFNRVIDEGPYKTLSTYTKVRVLLLCWAHSCSDLITKNEVDDLKVTFENDFNYHAEIKYLDSTIEQRLQVRVNGIVANFVEQHDGPDTLLIVYYAGHGRPGSEFGDLELFGQTSPNDSDDKKKRLDVLVWNKTEQLLMPAEADVLEIFDCCYAGRLGYITKGSRSFEYLAATNEKTPVPGDESFTRALIYSLKSLKKERADGRFTTVELLNKIKTAPDFPKDQTPMFFNREKKPSAGRIILHPLRREGSDDDLSPKEVASLDPFKRHALTLHFDFSEMPSPSYIERFGQELNECFERNVGVNGVRWGGMRQSMVARVAKSFQARLRRVRRASTRSNGANPGASFYQARPAENALDRLTPYSSDQHSPRTMDVVAKESPGFTSGDNGVISPVRPLDSNDESEDRVQDHRNRRKRRRI